MQILFELTAAQCEKVTRAGLDPRVVRARNIRVEVGTETVWAKCPIVGSGPTSETVVLPDGQMLTKLAHGGAR